MKVLLWAGSFLVVILVIYLIGPKAKIPDLNLKISEVPARDLFQLEKEIEAGEATVPGIKPDNQARIVWADESNRVKTEYSLVYLHGFSASSGEGYPLVPGFARRYGCNLYLARLFAHGIESRDALVDLTAENYLQSAKEALQVARQLGRKVIVMATSTGGTLALALASENTWIHALILYSPNIEVADKMSNILLKPWGLQLARLLRGKYRESDDPPEIARYWQSKYRLEAVQTMKALIRATMTPATINRIRQPLFLGYYYKNDQEQDKSVSVPRMLDMFGQISTPEEFKLKAAFPNAGCHPIPSSLFNRNVASVAEKTYLFAETVLEMKPVKTDR